MTLTNTATSAVPHATSSRASTATPHARIAAESFVLLKNEPFEGQGKKSSRPVLPLEKQGTVAVIGPLGNTRSNMPGTWSVAARLDDYPSLYEGLKEMTAAG